LRALSNPTVVQARKAGLMSPTLDGNPQAVLRLPVAV
jgi:hypothetical protein